MTFYTVRDLRTTPGAVWENLSKTGEAIITNNGKPTALLLDVEDCNFEEVLATVRQAKAMRAVNNIRIDAQRGGLSDMSEDELEAEIAAAREELKK